MRTISRKQFLKNLKSFLGDGGGEGTLGKNRHIYILDNAILLQSIKSNFEIK